EIIPHPIGLASSHALQVEPVGRLIKGEKMRAKRFDFFIELAINKKGVGRDAKRGVLLPLQHHPPVKLRPFQIFIDEHRSIFLSQFDALRLTVSHALAPKGICLNLSIVTLRSLSRGSRIDQDAPCLVLDEAGIKPVQSHELSVGAYLDDAAAVEAHDPVDR